MGSPEIAAFYADALVRSEHRNREWNKRNLLNVLEANKEKQVREVDASIALAKKYLALLDEPRIYAKPVPPRELVQSEECTEMKFVEPEVVNLLYGSTEKGSTYRYLKQRYKKSPEEKFNYRATTSCDYGWQQSKSRLPARDVNKGRCALLRDTFYRKNNLAPDPPHYSEPIGGEFSICSVYSCSSN
ncbi:PREDICTED: uncharacterized protein LOC106114096 [Papilio xuthus]|uniref:Uncharacterized protein LOC106114096 n=1 Tax=Papilio xuthus TaxID=66420 RepID=A0A194QIE3_PAPXU|nr:PREDICTED: uncharacterized protein LOC106114096 [Papilio xuthus]KPJ03221.1 hypothetical protein RR46_06377 [Papilio xuthus]